MMTDDDDPFVSEGIGCAAIYQSENDGLMTFHVDYYDEFGGEPGVYPFEAIALDPEQFYDFDWDNSSNQYPFLYSVMRRERLERVAKDLLAGPIATTIKGSYVDDDPCQISYHMKFMFKNETDRMMFATYFGSVTIL